MAGESRCEGPHQGSLFHEVGGEIWQHWVFAYFNQQIQEL